MTGWAVLGLEAAGVNPLDVDRGDATPITYLRRHGRRDQDDRRHRADDPAAPRSRSDPTPLPGPGPGPAAARPPRRRRILERPGEPDRVRDPGSAGGGDRPRATPAQRPGCAPIRTRMAAGDSRPGRPATRTAPAPCFRRSPRLGRRAGTSRAVAYLRGVQRSGGGFALSSGPVNAQSTAWAAQGLAAAGLSPASVRSGGRSALDYLASAQARDGHYRYSSSTDQTPVWVTGQALLAVERQAVPTRPGAEGLRPTTARRCRGLGRRLRRPLTRPPRAGPARSREAQAQPSPTTTSTPTGADACRAASRRPRRQRATREEAASRAGSWSFWSRRRSRAPPGAAGCCYRRRLALNQRPPPPLNYVSPMEVEEAIRTRRTHKAYRPEPVDRATLERVARPGPLGAQPQPDQPLALPGDRPGGPRAPQGGRRPRGGLQARPRPDAGRLLLRARAATRSRTRRTCTPPPAPRTSSCSPPTAAGWRATGARPECCARRRAARPSGMPERRALRRPAAPRPAGAGAEAARSGCRPTRSSSSSTDAPSMISRDQALAAMHRRTASTWSSSAAASPGAGVALDAASRGYSVALVERGDFAQGHLEPLLEDGPRRPPLPAELRPRAGPRGAARAPAAGPAGAPPGLSDAVPGARARRGATRPPHRHRPEHVRRDGDVADRAGAQPARASTRRRPTTGRPTATARSRARRRPSWSRPSTRSSRPRAYLFYDCQTDDVRLVLTVLGEAERFGAVLRQRRRGDRGARRRRPARPGWPSPRRNRASAFEVARRQRGQRHRASGPTGSGPTSCSPRRRSRRSAPAAARTSPSRTDDLRYRHGGLHRPGRGGADDLRPALVRARARSGTTDNDYEGDIDHVPPSGDDVEYLLDAAQRLLRDEPRRGRPHRRIRGGAAADLDRRPEEVGRHLAQGRALRDLVGDAHDHRRQAHHLAADGRAGRRPDRRARRPRGRVPHRRHPARHGRPRRRTSNATVELCRTGAAEQLAFRYGHAARAVLDLCEERAELAEPIAPGHPDLLAEVVIAARREQARSVGDVLLRRTRLGLVAAPELRDGRRVAAVARTLGEELGWRRSRISSEAEAWAEVSRVEGLDPSAALAK